MDGGRNGGREERREEGKRHCNVDIDALEAFNIDIHASRRYRVGCKANFKVVEMSNFLFYSYFVLSVLFVLLLLSV